MVWIPLSFHIVWLLPLFPNAQKLLTKYFLPEKKISDTIYKEFSQTYENIYFTLSYAQDDWYLNKCFRFSFMQNLLHHIYALNVDLQDGRT